jgi:uncharacterized membrane protein YfcA
LAALGGAAVVTGFVDTIAGGGGLITLPALRLGRVPPLQGLEPTRFKAPSAFSSPPSAIAPKRGWT